MAGEDHWQSFLERFREGMELFREASTSAAKADPSSGMLMLEPKIDTMFLAASKFDSALDLLELAQKAWPQHRKGLSTLKKAVFELGLSVHNYALVDEAISKGDLLKSRSFVHTARRAMEAHTKKMVELQRVLDPKLLEDVIAAIPDELEGGEYQDLISNEHEVVGFSELNSTLSNVVPNPSQVVVPRRTGLSPFSKAASVALVGGIIGALLGIIAAFYSQYTLEAALTGALINAVVDGFCCWLVALVPLWAFFSWRARH